MVVHIKLHSGKAARFIAIKAQMEESLGYEPTNPEVVGQLMGVYDEDDPLPL